MKQMLKRFMGLMLVLVLAFSTTIINVAASTKEVEVADDVKTTLIEGTKGIINDMSTLDEEGMEQLLQQKSPFIETLVDVWRTNKDELGGLIETTNETVSYDGEIYTITMIGQFENHTTDISVFVDNNFAPTSISLNIQYPLSYTLEKAGLNTLMGISTVFLMLLALSGIIYLFKFVNQPSKSKKQVEVPVLEESYVEETQELVDDLELVAVITAAIAASQNQSTDGFMVRSIKRADNKKWQRA